jgi:hypothetical protein
MKPESDNIFSTWRKYWWGNLGLFFVFMGTGMTARHFYFTPLNRTGFFNVTSTGEQLSLLALAFVCVLFLQPLLVSMRNRTASRVHALPETPDRDQLIELEVRKLGGRLLALVNATALFTLGVYLATGFWQAALLGGLFTLAFWAQTYPSPALLKSDKNLKT